MTSNLQHIDRLAKRAPPTSPAPHFRLCRAVGIFSAKSGPCCLGNLVASRGSSHDHVCPAPARGGPTVCARDQAGDNCYYLGLIYTLASLRNAIATFDPDQNASGIVQTSCALATTILA